MSNASNAPRTSRAEGPNDSPALASCLVQLAGSFGGFVVVLIMWIAILRMPPWTFTWRDALYWSVVLGTVAARRFHGVRYADRNSAGQTGPRQRVGLHAGWLVLTSGLAWGLAQSLHV